MVNLSAATKGLLGALLVVVIAFSYVTWFSFNQNAEIQEQNSALKSQNAGLLSQHSELQNTTITFQDQKTEFQNEIANLQKQINELQDQSTSLKKQNSDLQDRNSQLWNQTVDLRSQLDELNQTLSDLQSTAELKITDFSHSGPNSVVFGWTDWDFVAQVENCGKNNVSNGTLEVDLAISNGQLIRGVVQLPTLIAGESQEIRGYVEGPGVSVNFMELGATWHVTLKTPYTVYRQTYR